MDSVWWKKDWFKESKDWKDSFKESLLGRNDTCHSDDVGSADVEGMRGGGAISAHELAELTRNEDLKMLQALGGVEGVATIITLTVYKEIDGKSVKGHGDHGNHTDYNGNHFGRFGSTAEVLLAEGARVADASGMPRNTEEIRKRIYGINRTARHGAAPSCSFPRLFLRCMCDDSMVVLFASSFVSILLGIIQCVPIFVDVPQGNVHVRRCPAKPLWARHEPIQLPALAPLDGGVRCRSWMEGVTLLVMCIVSVAVNAAGEWWQMQRIFHMLYFTLTVAKATVIRQGLNMRVPFEQVLVGDLVLVTVGDMVPADGVLIESLGLKVDEDLFVRGHDPDDVRTKANNKNAFDSPFLSAGGLVLEGEGMFLVTGVGAYSNWNTLDAEGLGTRASLSKLVGVVPLRRPLERLAKLATRVGRGAVYVCMALRLCQFALRMWTSSCFDVVVEKCDYGYPGLNNRTLCHEHRYTWARHAAAFSSADLWVLAEAVMSTSALMLLLVPHGLTAVVSVFTISALMEARRDSLVIQSIKALEVMGRITSICIDKNSFLSSGPKRLAMAHICGVPFNGFSEDDSSNDTSEKSRSPHGSVCVEERQAPSALGAGVSSLESTSIFTFSTPTRRESGSTASGAAEAAVKTEATVKTRVPDAGGAEALPNYSPVAQQAVLPVPQVLQRPASRGLYSDSEREGGIPRASRHLAAVAHANAKLSVVSSWAPDSWIGKHLHASVAQILCEGFVFNTRPNCRGATGGATQIPVAASDARVRACERERGPEDHGIDAGVHAALETLGCACDVVFRARRQAVLRKWPFSKATKRSGALLSNDNGTGCFYASGAAKSILDRCAHLLLPDGKVIDMSAGQRMALNHVLFNLSNISLNGVALAYRLISKPHVFGLNCSQSLCADAEGPQLDSWLGNLEEHQQLLATDMVFVGILAFKNELGQDVPRAAALSKAVGVKMRIVTGEAMEAGKAAALACGLLPDGAIALNSSEWNAMTQGEQANIAPLVTLLAEATPQDKASLVRSLKASGEVVAACADCLDDEPMRDAASVICSTFRQGQQWSRQEADVICLDDDLRTLIAGVLRGRQFRSNVNSYAEFRVTFSLVVAVLGLVGAAGGCHILLPEQLLWMKMVVDTGAVLALAPMDGSCKAAAAVVSSVEPFSDSNTIVTSQMAIRVLFQGILQFTMLVFVVFYGRYWVSDCTTVDAHQRCSSVLANGLSAQSGWREQDQAYLYTLVLNALMCFQIGHLLGLRSVSRSNRVQTWQLGQTLTSKRFLSVVLLLLALHILFVQMGAYSPLRAVPIDAAGWRLCTTMAVLALITSLLARFLQDRMKIKTMSEGRLFSNSFTHVDDLSVSQVFKNAASQKASLEDSFLLQSHAVKPSFLPSGLHEGL